MVRVEIEDLAELKGDNVREIEEKGKRRLG